MPEEKPWEITIDKGIVLCRINLNVPDGITMACGVADRLKSTVLSMEAKALAMKAMKEMTTGIIKPQVVHPHPDENGNAA
jgi:hypothetical protein